MKRKLIIVTLAIIVGLGGCAAKKDTTGDMETSLEENGQESMDEQQQDEAAKENKMLLPRMTVTIMSMETQEKISQDEGEEFPLASVTYPAFEIPEETQEAYPKLSNSLQDDAATRQLQARKALAEAADLAADSGDSQFGAYSLNQQLEVVRADQKVFGYTIMFDSFYGGPHPYYWPESRMYDAQTGKKLLLADVMQDKDGLPQVLLENLEAIDGT